MAYLFSMDRPNLAIDDVFQSNQQTLKADIEEYVQDEKLRSTMDSVTQTEKGHGRIETRSAFTTNDVSWMPGGRQWPGLKCIGAIRTHFEYKGKVTDEWHYYISSKELTAADLLHHARMELGVETMRWLLDVRYREDYFRAQNENIQKNMNMSHKLALNLAGVYKNTHSKKRPLSHIMFDCLMDPHHLFVRGFNTPALCAVTKGIKARLQPPYENNIPRRLRRGMLIYAKILTLM